MYQAIVFLPLIGAIFAGFFGWLVPARASEVITTSLVLITALLSWFAFYQVGIEGHETRIELLRFIDSGALQTSWALRIDTLTAVMLVVVTTVSGLVHLYSIGYMEEDPHRPRFFAYLSLFTFAMLALVTADNFLQLFFGWEGVGLASYLLIGFWYHKPSANAAAIKAFIVNRVGDFGFALGIFAVFTVFNSLQYDTVFASAPDQVGKTMEFLGMQVDVLTTICLLLFVGAMGKSAQFLLHTWLPDAMEGPTPVSALIHAATMVTAGVFMVARLSPLFELAPIALAVVTIVGATTAFFAATVGLVQNDIKRVVAYSTCSQLGYMFVAEGVGAYGTGIFHLFTHAFFKALLFLSAGAVIHSMHHEQDMRKMGGLARAIPFTWAMMLIGNLALTGVGIPYLGIGLAGFYSKDAIINSAFGAHSGIGRPVPERHQAGDRLFDLLAAGLHVRRGRRVRLQRRHVPSLHPCLLQGAAVPVGGCGDPFHASRTGHAENGRAGARHSLHLGDDADRQSGADGGGHSLSGHRPGGLLFQGRHHQFHLCRPYRNRHLRLHPAGGVGRHDQLLFLAPVPDDLPWPLSRAGSPAPDPFR